MAQVTTGTSWVDLKLQSLVSDWGRVPDFIASWPGWSEDQKLDFVLDWPTREDGLVQLRDAVAAGQLNEEQEQRYHQLESLVALHRSTMDRLLDECED
jgi:hypothetical protein